MTTSEYLTNTNDSVYQDELLKIGNFKAHIIFSQAQAHGAAIKELVKIGNENRPVSLLRVGQILGLISQLLDKIKLSIPILPLWESEQDRMTSSSHLFDPRTTGPCVGDFTAPMWDLISKPLAASSDKSVREALSILISAYRNGGYLVRDNDENHSPTPPADHPLIHVIYLTGALVRKNGTMASILIRAGAPLQTKPIEGAIDIESLISEKINDPSELMEVTLALNEARSKLTLSRPIPKPSEIVRESHAQTPEHAPLPCVHEIRAANERRRHEATQSRGLSR